MMFITIRQLGNINLLKPDYNKFNVLDDENKIVGRIVGSKNLGYPSEIEIRIELDDNKISDIHKISDYTKIPDSFKLEYTTGNSMKFCCNKGNIAWVKQSDIILVEDKYWVHNSQLIKFGVKV